MKMILRTLTSMALLALAAGCTMFESDKPMFPANAGAPVYGTQPALIRWTMLEKDADPHVVRVDANFADGQYAMSARGKDKTHWSESLHPIAGAPDRFVQQIAYADESDPKVMKYYYDYAVRDASGLKLYQFRCTDLSNDERERFNMTPPPAPPNADGSPGTQSASCIVRSPESVVQAFQMLAARQQPRAAVTSKPKGTGWFSWLSR